MNNTAKKLTIEELKALPKASVVWCAFEETDDYGIVWHHSDPAIICEPGEGGMLLGGDKDGYFDHTIDDGLLNLSYLSIWDHEPNDDQLIGISETDYNSVSEDIHTHIQFTTLAAAITSKGVTFETLSDMTGIRVKRIYKILKHMDEISQCEIQAIRRALNLNDDVTRQVFFPEFAGMVYDIRTGILIEPAALAQI